MRLSAIKVAGFKSFVDATQLPLPTNLTGVVGPNGCGKSNIIDAVRWVLGETSMKNLRSSEMEDVIFNGSKSRKPVGRASVELVFDNSDGQIAGPYAAYTEIAVRRELTRDGNSQYYLNGRKSLKRDVTDLFLGTGLGGKNQYAIIEQGMVSSMITAKPEELRQWLEEAAGISRYKDRRRETESRIKQTRENLARLNDLRTELQQRLEVLHKQAANAEKYREYKQTERTLRAEILALKVRSLDAQCQSHEAAIAQAETELEQARAQAAAAVTGREQAETAQRDANHAVNAEQTRVYEAEAQLARKEQDLAQARQAKDYKLREIEQLGRQIGEVDERAARERQRLEDAGRALIDLENQVQFAQKKEAEAQEQVILADEEAQASQRRWDSFVQDAEAPLAQTEAERVRVQQLERARSQAEERFRRLETEHGSLNLAPIQASLFDADSDLTTLSSEIEQVQAQLASLDQQLQQLRDERGQAEGGLHESRQALASARGRMASLETLQQAALRQDDAELSAWLRQHNLSEAPRLASALRVESGWEGAVEHVLEGLLQAPLLADFDARVASINAAPRAGAVLLAEAGGGAGLNLAAKVTGPQAVLDLLSAIHVAATDAEARARAAHLAPGESVISADGTWRGRNWVRYPRRGDDQSGVIARGQLLRELKVQIEQLTQTVATRDQALTELTARMRTAEQERRDLGGKFDQSRGRHSQRLAFRQAQAVRLEQAQQRVQALMADMEQLRTAREQHAGELEESKQRLTALEATAAELRGQRAQYQQALAVKRDAVARARQAHNLAQQARGQVQINLASHKSALAALEQSLKDRGIQRESLVSRRSAEEQQAAQLDAPMQAQVHEVEVARAAVNQARDGLRAAREKLESVEQSFAGILQAAREADVAKDAAVEKLQAVKLEFENLRARREGFNAQIAETGFEREPLFAGLKEGATPEEWEEKLASILRRIERLGPINLAAIQELEEAKVRENYIGEQYADLTNALATLEEAIRKIDAETKELFRITFDKVDTIFREAFPRLFGGGEAYLELTGEDLLDTGVRVMARPPGKRNSSIQLLSGGEKAMTAVALLLALFQLTPAPFCLMDEVDAPLDDANVGRFCEVVREMAKNVQFIIITHNKITMELAQQLHGVTMQEPGVSRLVSVDVAQAVELAGKNETKE